MDTKTPPTSELKLFKFGTSKKLILICSALILWMCALIAYLIPGLDYSSVASFSSLRANYLFSNFLLFYTKNMIILVGLPLLILYIASFIINKLKPYRLVIFLAIMTLAIGNIIVDPILKDIIARPRPFVSYLDLNSLYFVNGYSFPSGHAFQAFAGTLPFIVCFLTNDDTFKRNWKKIALASILLIYAITLAFSRILAGVHYLSDVLFGIGFAILLMVILTSLLQMLLKNGEFNIQNEKWYALIFVILMLAYSLFYTG